MAFFTWSLLIVSFFLREIPKKACNGTPQVFRAGSTRLQLCKTNADFSSGLFLISLHSDETTANATAQAHVRSRGGTLLSLQNSTKRNVSFRLKSRVHTFDPNRIFTASGLQQTLRFHQSYSAAATSIVRDFGRFILDRVPDSALVVAVHNNTNNQYSILSYTDGGVFQTDARTVHVNEEMDGDDFFLTTDSVLYRELQTRNFNCVLQSGSGVTDDGSMSVYYGKRGRAYVNVEAQLGHYDVQLKMLETLHAITFDKRTDEQE